MKLEFFNRSAGDQAAIIREVAARRGISAVMVEKDFWVSWTLAVLFAHPEFGEQLVFKGGTSEEPPPFETVVKALSDLESRINQ